MSFYETYILRHPIGFTCSQPRIMRKRSQVVPTAEGRVPKPDGRLLFSEHGAAPDPGMAKWQRRIEPVWKPIAGGCHLIRMPDHLIEQGGLNIDRMETGYLPKSPKFSAYNYAGSARVA